MADALLDMEADESDEGMSTLNPLGKVATTVKSAAVRADEALFAGMRRVDDAALSRPSLEKCEAALADLGDIPTWWFDKDVRGWMLQNCHPLAGRSAETLDDALDEGPVFSREEFVNQCQLANYYVAQIELFAEMCLDRS